jgi:hypothetical protein
LTFAQLPLSGKALAFRLCVSSLISISSLWVLDLRILAETFRFIRYSSPSRGLVSSS